MLAGVLTIQDGDRVSQSTDANLIDGKPPFIRSVLHVFEGCGGSCGRGLSCHIGLRLPKSEQFVLLHTELPSWVIEAVANGSVSVAPHRGAVHRLKHEVLEIQLSETLRFRTGLRKYQLQLVASPQHDVASSFRAHTYPVDTRWSRLRAVCFDGDGEPLLVQGLDKWTVQLQEGFSSRADNKAPTSVTAICRPSRCHCTGDSVGISKRVTPRTISSDEVGVAELADGAVPIGFAARPQVASSEAAKDGRPPSVHSLTLQGVVDFLDRVTHRRRPVGSTTLAYAIGSFKSFIANP